MSKRITLENNEPRKIWLGRMIGREIRSAENSAAAERNTARVLEGDEKALRLINVRQLELYGRNLKIALAQAEAGKDVELVLDNEIQACWVSEMLRDETARARASAAFERLYARGTEKQDMLLHLINAQYLDDYRRVLKTALRKAKREWTAA